MMHCSKENQGMDRKDEKIHPSKPPFGRPWWKKDAGRVFRDSEALV